MAIDHCQAVRAKGAGVSKRYLLLWAFMTHYLCSNDLEKVCDIKGLMFDQVGSLASEDDKNTCYRSLGCVLLSLQKSPYVYKVLERASFMHALTMRMDKGCSLFSRIDVNCIVAQQDARVLKRPAIMQAMRYVLRTNHCLGEGDGRYKWLYRQLFVMTVCLYAHGLYDMAFGMQRALVAWDRVDAQGACITELHKKASEGRLAPLVPSLMVFAQRVFGEGVSEHQLQLFMMLQSIAFPAINQRYQQQRQSAVRSSAVATTPRCASVGASLFTPQTKELDAKRQKTVNASTGHASCASVSKSSQTAGASGLGDVVATSTGGRRESLLSNHGVFTRGEGKRKVVARCVMDV